MFNIDINKDKTQEALMVNKIVPRKLLTIDYDPYNLQEKVRPKVEYLDCAGDSINLPDIHFSNMLPSMEQRALDSYIEMAFEKIESNPTVLLSSNSPIRYSGKHKDRIKSILLEYLDEENFDFCCDYFRKSDIVTDILLGNRGAFRVISLYLVEPKTHKHQKHSKHYLKVVLLDPYHLFIPSRHKNLTSEQYKHQTYSEISSYTGHVKDSFKGLYKEDKL